VLLLTSHSKDELGVSPSWPCRYIQQFQIPRLPVQWAVQTALAIGRLLAFVFNIYKKQKYPKQNISTIIVTMETVHYRAPKL
jgi:hypothetical protein